MALLMRLLSRCRPATAPRDIKVRMECKAVMIGCGHAVYIVSDPRHQVIKQVVRQRSEEQGCMKMDALTERLGTVMGDLNKMFPNLDGFSAASDHPMDLPTTRFTPLFVIASTAGWSAPNIAQCINDKMIPPAAHDTGSEARAVVPLDQRT
ncbi:hypothetical protein AF72_03610 [Xylella taiwanensis]|nr:hypothetical protein AF72_03610 [Xylella taiwanensis]